MITKYSVNQTLISLKLPASLRFTCHTWANTHLYREDVGRGAAGSQSAVDWRLGLAESASRHLRVLRLVTPFPLGMQ